MLGMELMTGVLAQDPPRQTGPDFGKASPFGLIVVVVLLICTFLLVWSMNRHLNRLPKSFDLAENEQGADPDVTTDDPGDGTKRESS
ncbi:hypothetical protein C6A85_000000107270 [Mycobacterium sp. ITM-2017-0098]|nr:hypothetical protein C6A85_000000107270 [Mycobacterium sp. ITM-2017-0098]